VEFRQCVGSDGASSASNQDRVSLEYHTTRRFVSGEVLGVFVNEVLHLLHRIIQLSRDTGRCEIMNESPKSGDGGILVNKICRDPFDVEFRGILQRVQNGVANPSGLQADRACFSQWSGSGLKMDGPDLSQLRWKISSSSLIGTLRTLLMTFLANSKEVRSVHSLGKCLTAWAVSSTASYNASISGSYSAMIACRRAVNFAVRTNGFLGDETRTICSESSSDEGQCLITHTKTMTPPKKK
jgi:hypothetical protein